jgi:hypothetical protein
VKENTVNNNVRDNIRDALEGLIPLHIAEMRNLALAENVIRAGGSVGGRSGPGRAAMAEQAEVATREAVTT